MQRVRLSDLLHFPGGEDVHPSPTERPRPRGLPPAAKPNANMRRRGLVHIRKIRNRILKEKSDEGKKRMSRMRSTLVHLRHIRLVPLSRVWLGR